MPLSSSCCLNVIPEVHVTMVQHMFMFKMMKQEDKSYSEATRMALSYSHLDIIYMR